MLTATVWVLSCLALVMTRLYILSRPIFVADG
ncbi:hypothetical protein BH11ARM2_BH11ARM2_04960 [soil metagenome]